MESNTPIPIEVKLRKQSRLLELGYENGEFYSLSFEFLRVFTPSAEARGHGPGQEVIQTGKRDVLIERIEPVGNYALRFIFSDGHDSGLYSWDWLYKLAKEHDHLWQEYLNLIEAEGLSRDVDTTSQIKAAGCSQH